MSEEKEDPTILMEVNLNLTSEEIERYAPYHTSKWFACGYFDYKIRPNLRDMSGVDSQAYNRGAECAMRRQMKK
jgi:hypothetical protein